MFMRPTQFAPQITYNADLLGASWKSKRLSKYEAKLQFNEWLQKRFPAVADKARGFGAGMHGMGADAAAPKSWWQELLTAAPQAVAAASQYKIIKLNLERAAKGLPPIDTAIAAPTVRVQTELDPASRKTLNYAGIGLAALGGLLGLKLLKVI